MYIGTYAGGSQVREPQGPDHLDERHHIPSSAHLSNSPFTVPPANNEFIANNRFVCGPHKPQNIDRTMNDPSSSLLWTQILLSTALCLALVVITHIFNTYAAAYYAAPHEITTYTDVVEYSITENDSYDRDAQKVQRLEDKLRLNALLREIQKCSDDLREDLNRIMVNGTLRTSARLQWATNREQLGGRVRRLDMLRMRFLVVYMGVVAGTAGERVRIAERTMPKDPEKASLHHQYHTPHIPKPPPLPKGLTDHIKQRPPLRRLTTQATGHRDNMETPPRKTSLTPDKADETPHRMGWMGVVQELQRSPLMHKRHASIEMAMRSPPPMSPIGSPLSLTPKMDNDRFHQALDSPPEEKI
ncbi:uncharacterized protein F4822DRAFT_400805 [Hypoxylon trugodes]|uniref:uncharacterized protein n=1 Tax=Hypoxylon trugodes TaxID=326681 RepID=UPI00219130E1|nr:uncharacterized protein F4822DRAFT_400805 [Hypoxylon trugodes]KAI1390075.1 hypothetical protein F4822DRAFT_400805 [Hypoxylon trugodes]